MPRHLRRPLRASRPRERLRRGRRSPKARILLRRLQAESQAAEAEAPAATGEEQQVASAEASGAAQEPEQQIEIGPVEANAPTVEASAEATIGTIDLSGLAVAAVEGQAEGLSLSGEAAPGAIPAGKVTIKAAEAEAGTLYVAGAAPPGVLVLIYANDELVGEARAGADGTWLLEAKKDVPVGEVVFRVEAAPEHGAGEGHVVEASAPFMRFEDGVVLEPIVTVMSGDQALLSDAEGLPRPTYVIIRRGDNLWRIARRNYGRGVKYKAIFAANKDSIRHPHWIFPGQVFIIPTRDRSWETVSN